jgi:hypothetical protein
VSSWEREGTWYSLRERWRENGRGGRGVNRGVLGGKGRGGKSRGGWMAERDESGTLSALMLLRRDFSSHIYGSVKHR